MNDHAKAIRAAFLDAELKHRRIIWIVRWVGAAYRRLHSVRPFDALAGLHVRVELDSSGLAHVAVRGACASRARCDTNKKGRRPLVSRQT